jgi:hypothetical protein
MTLKDIAYRREGQICVTLPLRVRLSQFGQRLSRRTKPCFRPANTKTGEPTNRKARLALANNKDQ